MDSGRCQQRDNLLVGELNSIMELWRLQRLKCFIMSQTTQGRTMRCPFDSSHVMPYDRFLNHLDKCKFPDKKSYLKCKYNPYHVIHKDCIASHESKCEDRTKYKEESDDDWGVQPEELIEVKVAKPGKSTVSTAITTNFSNNRSKPAERKEVKLYDNSHMMAESFDDYDFKKDYGRK